MLSLKLHNDYYLLLLLLPLLFWIAQFPDFFPCPTALPYFADLGLLHFRMVNLSVYKLPHYVNTECFKTQIYA